MEDIHYVYGLADGNATEAMNTYRERFPNYVLPYSRLLSNIHRHFSENGSFIKEHHKVDLAVFEHPKLRKPCCRQLTNILTRVQGRLLELIISSLNYS